MPIAIVVALITVVPVGSVSGRPTLPPGWVYIEKEGVDTLRGAYHDSVSGAFVRTEVAFESTVIPWVSGKAARHGVRLEESAVGSYRMQRVKVAGQKKGCEEEIASFLREDMSWNIASLVCTPLQKARLAQLLTDLPMRYPNWPPPNDARNRGLDEHDLLAVATGLTWMELRSRVGPPNDVVSAPEGGFVVRYDMGPNRVILRFDREHRLAEVRRQ